MNKTTDKLLRSNSQSKTTKLKKAKILAYDKGYQKGNKDAIKDFKKHIKIIEKDIKKAELKGRTEEQQRILNKLNDMLKERELWQKGIPEEPEHTRIICEINALNKLRKQIKDGEG